MLPCPDSYDYLKRINSSTLFLLLVEKITMATKYEFTMCAYRLYPLEKNIKNSQTYFTHYAKQKSNCEKFSPFLDGLIMAFLSLRLKFCTYCAELAVTESIHGFNYLEFH